LQKADLGGKGTKDLEEKRGKKHACGGGERATGKGDFVGAQLFETNIN